MSNNEIQIGQTLVCHKTGQTFIAANEGMTVNYCRDHHGNVYSNEGARLLELEGLRDAEKHFVAYVSSDEKSITDWKGNPLGRVTARKYKPWRTNKFGEKWFTFYITDVHGRNWRGVSQGAGMYIKMVRVK